MEFHLCVRPAEGRVESGDSWSEVWYERVSRAGDWSAPIRAKPMSVCIVIVSIDLPSVCVFCSACSPSPCAPTSFCFALRVGQRKCDVNNLCWKHTMMKPAPSLPALFLSTIKKLPLLPASFCTPRKNSYFVVTLSTA